MCVTEPEQMRIANRDIVGRLCRELDYGQAVQKRAYGFN